MRKFEACSPLLSGLCEELQVNTGEKIGLGSMDYTLVDVPERPGTDFSFPPDPRLTGIRYRKQFRKIPPFPYDRHDGHGFDRVEKVDLDTLNNYRESNGGK